MRNFRLVFGIKRPWVQVPQPGPNKDAIIDTKRISGFVLIFFIFAPKLGYFITLLVKTRKHLP